MLRNWHFTPLLCAVDSSYATLTYCERVDLQCAFIWLFSLGAIGIVQAITLSFGGLQFSAGHFEFAANPASLHTTITFRHIHLYEDMDIYLTVLVNEETGHAEKLTVKPVKGGKTPLYACEAGCQYDPVEVG